MKNLIFIWLVLIPYLITAQEKVSWKYPISLGSKEWKETSYLDKIRKSQPPAELMVRMSTAELFDYCIDYPFNKDVLLFNNPDAGFKRVIEYSTVWQEFIKRTDASIVFMKYYSAFTCTVINNLSDRSEKTSIFFNLFFLEKIVSETSFLDNLNSIEKKKLASVLYSKFKEKKQYPELFLGYNYNSSLSALVKILETDNQKGMSLEKFKETTTGEYFVVDEAEKNITAKVNEYIQ